MKQEWRMREESGLVTLEEEEGAGKERENGDGADPLGTMEKEEVRGSAASERVAIVGVGLELGLGFCCVDRAISSFLTPFFLG